MDFNKIKIISAGAGSGKTYQLGEELNQLLETYDISQIMATSFTKKAASELQERLAIKLTEKGKVTLASRIEEAFIGTVNSVCGKLLDKFALEAGLKPELKVLDEKQAKETFKLAISSLWSEGALDEIAALSSRFGVEDIQDKVMDIGKLMLSNNMDKSTIDESKRFSKESYLACLGNSKQNPSWLHDAEALAKRTLGDLKKEKNTTHATLAYQNKLQDFINEVHTNNHSWKTVGWLHSNSPAAPLRPLVEELITHLAKDHQLEDFQHDLENLIDGVFDLALAAINKYNRFKKERGLIDFTDQEVLLNQVFENEEVLNILCKEIKVLMVDEFQDTSPIQLKIFLRIAEVVDKVVFVGDTKQCIYEFRDSDTYLINKLIERCGGIKKENILDTSYRSREPLVAWVNTLFKDSFKDIKAEQVVLKANRKEDGGLIPAIHLWKFETEVEQKGKIVKKAPTKPLYLEGIAQEVQELLEIGQLQIMDPNSSEMRKPSPGDIGILCNTNNNCQELAEKLKHLNIPTAVENSGLMNTAEVKLIMAAFKRLIFKGDSLSTAEILFLTDKNLSHYDLLNSRLRSLNDTENQWGSNSPILKKLDDIQDMLLESSPSVTLNKVINVIDVYSISGRWGDHQQRIANIQKLISLAKEYEERAGVLSDTASVSGFIIFMENLQKDKKDYTGILPNANAVQVLTYHKSKGLEWPIVLMLDLDRTEKNYEGLFSAKMQVDEARYDIEKPLDNRLIKYWPWPYGINFGKLSGGSEFKKLFDGSPVKQKEFEKYLEEEKRLMYVGITRARDYLILPYKNSKQIWFGRVFGDDIKAKLFTPVNLNGENHTGSSWDGKEIFYNHKSILVQQGEENPNNTKDDVNFYQPFPDTPITQRESKYISPSSISPLDKSKVLIKKQDIHGRLPLVGSNEMDVVGTCVHNILAAIDWDNQHQWEKPINRLLEGYELKTAIDDKLLKERIAVFIDLMKSRYNPNKIYRELPLKTTKDGQVLTGFIDLLLEVPEGFILIDYKTFPGGYDKLEEWSMKYTGQLSKYKEMIEVSTGKKVIDTLIYYPVNGSIISVNYN